MTARTILKVLLLYKSEKVPILQKWGIILTLSDFSQQNQNRKKNDWAYKKVT